MEQCALTGYKGQRLISSKCIELNMRMHGLRIYVESCVSFCIDNNALMPNCKSLIPNMIIGVLGIYS